MTGCQCTEAGWCERHKVQKSARLVYLCQNDEKYWAAWETGHGPKQGTQGGVSKRVQPKGPGTELRKLIGCCGWQHVHDMNAWGVEGCCQRSDQIVMWMVEHGCDMPAITEAAARRLLNLAIERAALQT